MKAGIQSTTIKGIIVMVLPVLFLLLRTFGVIDIPVDEQSGFIGDIERIIDLVAEAIILVGARIAWIGRKRATEPLGGFFKV